MGGTARKRSADQLSSANAGTDPGAMEGVGGGSATGTVKKTRSSRKKKDKRSKKSKETDNASGNIGGSKTKDGSPLEITATAEGKQMAQVLSTFSRLEQSRFEAFRKASFPGDAIAKFVAHCLIHEQHRPLSGSIDFGANGISGNETETDGLKTANGGLSNGADPNDAPDSNNLNNKDNPNRNSKAIGNKNGNVDSNAISIQLHSQGRPTITTSVRNKSRFRHLRPVGCATRKSVLSEVVAPGQAGDITVVVSTLAKEYAQRLVMEARRHASERKQRKRRRKLEQVAQRRSDAPGEAGESESDGSLSEEDEDPSTSPRDILEAYAHRQARGLDPGFFLNETGGGPSNGVCVSGVLADPDVHRRQDLTRKVTLAAQRAYDEEARKKTSEGEGEEQEQREQQQDEEDEAVRTGDNEGGAKVMEIQDREGNGDGNNDEKQDTKEAVETWDYLQPEERGEMQEDPSEKAVWLYARHVHRMVARQHGISIVTSDSETEPENEGMIKRKGTPNAKPNEGSSSSKSNAEEPDVPSAEAIHKPNDDDDNNKDQTKSRNNSHTEESAEDHEVPKATPVASGAEEDATLMDLSTS